MSAVNGSIGAKVPPPAVKPRPKSNSISAGSSGKAPVAPPPVKKKPVAPPTAAKQATPPPSLSPDPQASPSKCRPRPPPPTRNQSLAVTGHEDMPPSPPSPLPSTAASVSVKEAAEMVLADSFPAPPPMSPPYEPEPAVMSPPPPATRPRGMASLTSPPPPDVAPRPRGRSATLGTSAPASSLPPLQVNSPAPKMSLDEDKYNEIESLIAGFMGELDDQDFFSKAMEEFSEDVSTV